MLFGSKRGLIDARTEEEKQRDLQRLLDPLSSKPAEPFGLQMGMSGASNGSKLPVPMGHFDAPRFGEEADQRFRAIGGIPADVPRLPAHQRSPDLAGNWSQFDPSNMPERPKQEVLPRSRDLAGAPRKAERAPWESTGREKFGNVLGIIGNTLMAAQAARDGDHRTAAYLGQLSASGIAERHRRAQLGSAMRNMGYDDNAIVLALSDPDSIGKNFNTRLQSRVVAPGSSVVEGGPRGPRSAYRQPNQFEQYAGALGHRPGTPGFDTAVQDYTLRGNGPTAHGYDLDLDDERTANDIQLEGVRQRNRLRLRQTPTYRDVHAPPPRPVAPRTGGSGGGATGPTATGPNGEKIRWNGRAWVPVR